MMHKTLLSAATKATLQGSVVARRQLSVSKTALSRFSASSPGLTALAFSLVSSSAGIAALCEGKDKGFFESIAQKDKDGNTDWMKSVTQVADSDFWDKVAKASGEKIQGAYDTGIPSQLSYGFVCGYCSGYALKTIGRGAAVVFGLGFMSLQTLSYYGYIEVDHAKLQKDFEKTMDLNKDGKVDQADAQLAMDKIMSVLQYSLPAGGGFGGGFVAGVRSG
ncbi:FUN14 domain-containing protein 2 [Seminavis robusta]|uniref:FUN14 domain-containing protein 2 n=1 Tax=Seminavis robusta TaxID=568900 RepID=A0A9N8DC56_9STRA|nr:FUN14 domain-containing protein 2 [Seminavis robusta]|eukprot:Sro80_g043270.1 FUN14 domain-containing protein 2 (220) ;mRNA; r:119474-120363